MPEAEILWKIQLKQFSYVLEWGHRRIHHLCSYIKYLKILLEYQALGWRILICQSDNGFQRNTRHVALRIPELHGFLGVEEKQRVQAAEHSETGSKELWGVKRWPEIYQTKKGQQVKKSSGDRTGAEEVEGGGEKKGQEVKLIQAK